MIVELFEGTIDKIQQRKATSLFCRVNLHFTNPNPLEGNSLDPLETSLGPYQFSSKTVSETLHFKPCVMRDKLAYDPVWYFRAHKILNQGYTITNAHCNNPSCFLYENMTAQKAYEIYNTAKSERLYFPCAHTQLALRGIAEMRKNDISSYNEWMYKRHLVAQTPLKRTMDDSDLAEYLALINVKTHGWNFKPKFLYPFVPKVIECEVSAYDDLFPYIRNRRALRCTLRYHYCCFKQEEMEYLLDERLPCKILWNKAKAVLSKL